VTSPYNDSRDSNNPGFGGEKPASDIADAHLGSFRDAFRPPSDQLSEQDYRTTESGGSPGAPFDNAAPQRADYTYPSVHREPKSV